MIDNASLLLKIYIPQNPQLLIDNFNKYILSDFKIKKQFIKLV